MLMTRSTPWLVPFLISAACSASNTIAHTTGHGAAGPCDELPENQLRRGVEENGPSFNGTSLDDSAVGRRGIDGDATALTSAIVPRITPEVLASGPSVPASRPGSALRVARLCKGVTLRDHTVRYDVVVEGAQLTAPGPLAADFAGAILLGIDTEGKVVQLRIDHIAPGSGARSAVTLYTLSYQRGTVTADGSFAPSGGAGWSPLCPPGMAALALAGRWDYHSGQRGDGGRLTANPAEVSFACQGSAIAKCVERLGYKPWQTARRSNGTVVSGDQLHQACVRAVRADYCGDGVSLTRAGEPVNYYDAVGIQKDTRQWDFEAEWTPQGARCVSGTRLLNVPGAAQPQTVQEYINDHCPTIWQVGSRPCVVDPQRSSALLWTEYPTRPQTTLQ